jgi:hypothetical protein
MSDENQDNIYEPPNNNRQPELRVTNPIQAASEIFYKPKDVFDALAVRDNWSWIPFILLMVILFIPPYLYFGVVDFDWYINTAIAPTLEDMAPAQQESMLSFYTPNQMQLTVGISIIVSGIIMSAIVAFYYAMTTKNDPKSVQGFTDWYGAMWWMTMPGIINALIALVLLTFQSSGAEINIAITNPLSLAYILGVEMSSDWFGLLTTLRLDTIWMIYIGVVCLQSWTNFSRNKAILIASIPTIVILLIMFAVAAF